MDKSFRPPRVIADSISPAGARITTLLIYDYWKLLVAEFNTHRACSRNSASSRAIPTDRFIQRILEKPFVPRHWGKNQKGMAAGAPLPQEDQDANDRDWLEARDTMLAIARRIQARGTHKQNPNRLLEPFMLTEIQVTATDWSNLLGLRTETMPDGTPMAEPHFYDAAKGILDALNASQPKLVLMGQWHLPWVNTDAIDWRDEAAVNAGKYTSGARTGRTSYLTHEGKATTAEEDEIRCKAFITDGHFSPLEHQATPLRLANARSGNLRGWTQWRKTFVGHERTCPDLKQKKIQLEEVQRYVSAELPALYTSNEFQAWSQSWAGAGPGQEETEALWKLTRTTVPDQDDRDNLDALLGQPANIER